LDQARAQSAWRLLLAAAAKGRKLASSDRAVLSALADGPVTDTPYADADAVIQFDSGRWSVSVCKGPSSLFDLYLPLCSVSSARPLIVGHLGQSLDGQIATLSGDSDFVTGASNLDHLHRMRALADAVIVGAGTVDFDNPQLTTRRVVGPSPVRVIIDPRCRLDASSGVLGDGAAPTLWVTGRASKNTDGLAFGVDKVVVACIDGKMDLLALVDALRDRGLHSLFVEGGGKTVSAFLRAGLLDRLQITGAPVLIGEGTPALSLPGKGAMSECLRPPSQLYRMGEDVLFDCDLRAGESVRSAPGAYPELPQRIT